MIDAGGTSDVDAGPSDLIARWDFAEGTGTTTADTSGVPPALDLTISGAHVWIQGGIRILATNALLTTSMAATKVSTSAKSTNEFTVEVWAVPENTTQSGPARFVTFSEGIMARNFLIGQNFSAVEGRLRNTGTNDDGSVPPLASGGALVPGFATHLVLTHAVGGARRLYVDGVLVGSDVVDGDLSNWTDGYRLYFANENTLDRGWLGDLLFAAIYRRALSDAEIAARYQLGSNPP